MSDEQSLGLVAFVILILLSFAFIIWILRDEDKP